MDRTYLCLPFEYLDEMEELTDEEYGRLVRALQRYSMTGEAISPVGNERFYAKRVMRTEDHFKACFEEKAEKRSASGRKAANARWNKNANVCERIQTHNDALNRNAENAPIVLDIDIDNSNIESNKLDNNVVPNSNVVPKEKERKKEKEKNDEFDLFWSVYPNKKGKGAARTAFAKAQAKGVPVETMIAAVEVQKMSKQWTKDGGEFIPHPATWLNQERWEDSVGVEVVDDDSWNPFLQIAKEEHAKNEQRANGGGPVDNEGGLPFFLSGHG